MATFRKELLIKEGKLNNFSVTNLNFMHGLIIIGGKLDFAYNTECLFYKIENSQVTNEDATLFPEFKLPRLRCVVVKIGDDREDSS